MNLDQLYRSLITDHAKNPRRKGLKGYPSCHLRNPSCGDEITIEALVEKGKVREVNHDGHGCSICCASASILCELTSGKSKEEVDKIIHEYYKMIQGDENLDEELLEDALALHGVAQFPARTKCATISWKALEEVLGENHES
ncbi:MAG: SUF system NifU family Fe-S cluster assembly protein [Bacilli bacterium]|nr:SUF system NifU family Fe-S cluster assembly protein [Bacilli bacterium]